MLLHIYASMCMFVQYCPCKFVRFCDHSKWPKAVVISFHISNVRYGIIYCYLSCILVDKACKIKTFIYYIHVHIYILQCLFNTI
jgi:hypothetical protein